MNNYIFTGKRDRVIVGIIFPPLYNIFHPEDNWNGTIARKLLDFLDDLHSSL